MDIFAGPGGLGEGFSSMGEDFFRIAVSAEKDPAAHRTLHLRKFYRALADSDRRQFYFDEVSKGNTEFNWRHFRPSLKRLWEHVGREALNIELGTDEGDAELDRAIRTNVRGDRPWVLIGGPPCQAYSLAGRVRNRGVVGYDAAKDDRHFLYRSYLRILEKHGPSVFVMENVKGLLSARVNGERMIELILRDLRSVRHGQHRYELFALEAGDPSADDGKAFLIRAENHGVPQARHRIIIIGVREDLLSGGRRPGQLSVATPPTLQQIIGDLPRLRSNLSRRADGKDADVWRAEYLRQLDIVSGVAPNDDLRAVIHHAAATVSNELLDWDGYRSGMRLSEQARVEESPLCGWLRDTPSDQITNHQARSHMVSDLGRYAFCSAWAQVAGRSPSARDFPNALAPQHKNWKSGKFTDRFRAQLSSGPSNTVTSHIAKDGHYYIHWDTSQGRSLTVREAARIQTFPDSYHFLGNRTQQYAQVGNAVPPYLARRIAEIVHALLTTTPANESARP